MELQKQLFQTGFETLHYLALVSLTDCPAQKSRHWLSQGLHDSILTSKKLHSSPLRKFDIMQIAFKSVFKYEGKYNH